MKKLLALLLLSPLVVSEELISLDEFFSSEQANAISSAELTIYSLEKCSAITFISIGGDNPEVEDIGDVFLETAFIYRVDNDQDIDWEVHQENNLQSTQKYFKEYETHWSKLSESNSGELFTELMKEDLKFCMRMYEIIDGDIEE